MSGYKAEWHKYPDEFPEEGQTCLAYTTKLQFIVKCFHNDRITKNILFWTELPEPPQGISKEYAEIARLKAEVDALSSSLLEARKTIIMQGDALEKLQGKPAMSEKKRVVWSYEGNEIAVNESQEEKK